MKTRDKQTIKKLSEQIQRMDKFEDQMLWVFVILCLIGIGFIVIIGQAKLEVEQELQECQEKVEVWTLEYKCIRSADELLYVQRNFSNYENYNDYKLYYDRGSCEVIK